MSLRDQYTAATQEKDRQKRDAAAANAPKGPLKRIDEALQRIAGTLETDLNQRINDIKAGKKAAGPLIYRIENISNMPEKDMKDVRRLDGYKQLGDACARPDIDVRVDVNLHRGCLNNGVDIRVFPGQPASASSLAIDGFPVRKLPRLPATSRKAATPQSAIPLLKPLAFKLKAGA